jgi:hypothetical protein
MAELIGVIDGFHALRPSFLKRTALLFDRMALPGKVMLDQWSVSYPAECQDLSWLLDNEIVFQVSVPNPDALSLTDEDKIELKTFSNKLDETFAKMLDNSSWQNTPSDILLEQLRKQLDDPELDSDTKLKIVGYFLRAGEHVARMFGCLLRSQGMKAYPVLSTTLSKQSTALPSDVIEIVFNNFPTPSEDTPWEQILEYRADPDSRANFFALRDWINEITHASLSPIEIEEKLEHLLAQYERHLKLHKMKTNKGVVETVLTSGAGFAENLCKGNFSKIANMLFTAKHRKLALYEGELTAPGHELAYILKTQEAFS